MARQTILEYLEGAKQRPEIHSRYPTDSAEWLYDLETRLDGYDHALCTHGIVEDGPSMAQQNFGRWLSVRHPGWTWLNCGWARAIVEELPNETPREAFFALFDEYRQLTPRVTGTVFVENHHRFPHREETPVRVDLIHYEPAPMHFARFLAPDGGYRDATLRYLRDTRDDVVAALADHGIERHEVQVPEA